MEPLDEYPRRIPAPSELLPAVEEAKAIGQTWIEFEIPSRDLRSGRYAPLWDKFSGRIVSTNFQAVTVRVHLHEVEDAARIEAAQKARKMNEPLAVNRVGPPPRLSTNR
jgi:hypothetical protein